MFISYLEEFEIYLYKFLETWHRLGTIVVEVGMFICSNLIICSELSICSSIIKFEIWLYKFLRDVHMS